MLSEYGQNVSKFLLQDTFIPTLFILKIAFSCIQKTCKDFHKLRVLATSEDVRYNLNSSKSWALHSQAPEVRSHRRAAGPRAAVAKSLKAENTAAGWYTHVVLCGALGSFS